MPPGRPGPAPFEKRAKMLMPSAWYGYGGIYNDSPWRTEREVVAEILATGTISQPEVDLHDDPWRPERYPWQDGNFGRGSAERGTRYRAPLSKAARDQEEWEAKRLHREKVKQARSDELWDADAIKRRKKKLREARESVRGSPAWKAKRQADKMAKRAKALRAAELEGEVRGAKHTWKTKADMDVELGLDGKMIEDAKASQARTLKRKDEQEREMRIATDKVLDDYRLLREMVDRQFGGDEAKMKDLERWRDWQLNLVACGTLK